MAHGHAAQPVGMRLNHLQDTAGGGGPDLAHSSDEKKTAADTLHNDIEPNTKKAGAWADDDTAAVVAGPGRGVGGPGRAQRRPGPLRPRPAHRRASPASKVL